MTLISTNASFAPAPESRIGSFTAMVVDDDPAESMVTRLQDMGAGSVIRAFTRTEALALADAEGPRDLGIINLALRDGGGLELLIDLRSAGWSRLIVLLAADDRFSVRSAFAAGAQGYLLANTAAERVRARVRQVCGDRAYADPSAALALTLVGAGDGLGRGSVAQLSAREVEVLRLVAQGRSNRGVGEDLHLSALTVKSHLARIARKLGTGDRAEMVAMTMRAGLIS